MTTQPEATLENNLIKQLMCLGYAVIKINNAEALESFLKSQLEAIKRLIAAAICLRLKMEKRNKMLKTYIHSYINSTFVPTVLATLPIRTASQGESFAFYTFRFPSIFSNFVSI